MTTLYIIGNGFDIHHGLNSRYTDFCEYTKVNKPDVYRNVSNYLNISEKWIDFEEALEYLDIDSIFDDAATYYVGYGAEDWSDANHHSYQWFIDETVKSLSEELYDFFISWINIVDENIDINQIRKLEINKNSVFLNFNYTQTLEKIYSISNVNHIHGVVGDYELALGHAWSSRKQIPINDEDDDIRINQGIEILNTYFGRTFKNCSKIIDENKMFFQELTEVNKIVILGHSLGSVDIPYFKEIKKHIMENTIWYCSYYGEDDHAAKKRALIELGIKNPILDSMESIAVKSITDSELTKV